MAEAVTHQLPFYRNGNTTGDLSHTSSAQIFIFVFFVFFKEDKQACPPPRSPTCVLSWQMPHVGELVRDWRETEGLQH
jgi:hypothetical protein